MPKRIGSRKVKSKILNVWTETDIQEALHELQSVSSSTIRGVAKKYGVHEATLRFRLKKINNKEILKKSGRKCVLSDDAEKELAQCILVCNLGFSPTITEITVYVIHV